MDSRHSVFWNSMYTYPSRPARQSRLPHHHHLVEASRWSRKNRRPAIMKSPSVCKRTRTRDMVEARTRWIDRQGLPVRGCSSRKSRIQPRYRRTAILLEENGNDLSNGCGTNRMILMMPPFYPHCLARNVKRARHRMTSFPTLNSPYLRPRPLHVLVQSPTLLRSRGSLPADAPTGLNSIHILLHLSLMPRPLCGTLTMHQA